MPFKSIALMLFSFIMVLMPGCREYHLYRYKPVAVEVLGGELLINLEGDYSEDYEKDGKKLADWGGPYMLQFMFSMPFDHGLFKLVVKDIEIIGEKSSRYLSLPNVESDKVKDPRLLSFPNARGRTVMKSVSFPTEGFEYETYLVKATIVVYEDSNTFKEKNISVRLETDYKKTKRSDWFDEKMSV